MVSLFGQSTKYLTHFKQVENSIEGNLALDIINIFWYIIYILTWILACYPALFPITYFITSDYILLSVYYIRLQNFLVANGNQSPCLHILVVSLYIFLDGIFTQLQIMMGTWESVTTFFFFLFLLRLRGSRQGFCM